MTSEASVALVRKSIVEMLRVRIAIRIQTAIVHVIKTELVPTTVIAGRQVRPHTDHAGSAQGTTGVSVAETT
jgi:hypothetical protein